MHHTDDNFFNFFSPQPIPYQCFLFKAHTNDKKSFWFITLTVSRYIGKIKKKKTVNMLSKWTPNTQSKIKIKVRGWGNTSWINYFYAIEELSSYSRFTWIIRKLIFSFFSEWLRKTHRAPGLANSKITVLWIYKYHHIFE